MTKFAVTGANGFVGRALCAELIRRGHWVRAIVRTTNAPDFTCSEVVVVPDIGLDVDWEDALQDIEIVIHLAARVHVMREDSLKPIDAFRQVNVTGTECLARAAARGGVRRFIYVSSIGVNGAETSLGRPFTEQDNVNPHSAYALSKWEAEQILLEIAEASKLGVVILRPPLVYGRNAPGNFSLMLKSLASGMPLPLASIKNLRSFIYIENLVDALILCALHKDAAGSIYLVSDSEEISTPDLLRLLGETMNFSVRLLPFPIGFLKFGGRLIGKTDQMARLVGSLRIDNGKIRRELNWKPPFTLVDGLSASASEITEN
ncbi:NAD-dependent epimerase/dehydratase family protein [Herminiimonas sp. NPDC097707]|uniref:NAD-dependent epimerase/dehydratase family protein n=1 Tax=Herminiimonas sp. NPDC097707 TaxID=3364007 RepID=UPI00383BD0D7